MAYYSRPKREGYRLTELGNGLFEQWNDSFDGGNCTCVISPPCSCCTHEGHPLNLLESTEPGDFIWEVDDAAAQESTRHD